MAIRRYLPIFIIMIVSALSARDVTSGNTGEVVFFRKFVFASELHVLHNEEIVGSLKNYEYFVFKVPVGDQLFFAFQKTAFDNSNYKVDLLLVNIEAGKKYYVKLTQNYGFANLLLMNVNEAENQIVSCRKRN